VEHITMQNAIASS